MRSVTVIIENSKQSATAYLLQGESGLDPESLSGTGLRIIRVQTSGLPPKFNGDFSVKNASVIKIFQSK